MSVLKEIVVCKFAGCNHAFSIAASERVLLTLNE